MAFRGRWLILGAALTWAGCEGGCDPKCNPAKEDCSLSPVCCSPPAAPAPLTLGCRNLSTQGDVEVSLELRVVGGIPPHTYRVAWGDAVQDGRVPESTFVLTHSYRRPTSGSHDFPIIATVIDSSAGPTSQVCASSQRVDGPSTPGG